MDKSLTPTSFSPNKSSQKKKHKRQSNRSNGTNQNKSNRKKTNKKKSNVSPQQQSAANWRLTTRENIKNHIDSINKAIAKFSEMNPPRDNLKEIVNYMVTKYGNESICINIPMFAFKDLGAEKFPPEINFNDFKIPNNNTGIYLIKIDIVLINPERFWQNENIGKHIHSFLIIYDSHTQSYQILSASNGGYMLKEYYYGKLMDCVGTDLSEFPNTEELMRERKEKEIMSDPVSIRDVDSFVEFYSLNTYPRQGNDFKKIVDLINSVSSSSKDEKAIYVNTVEIKHTLNLMIGFDNFIIDTKYDPDMPYYFLHNFENPNDVSYIRCFMTKCLPEKISKIYDYNPS